MYYIFYIMFLFYAVWDWKRTKALRDALNSGTVFFGIKQATAAWCMKILVTYFFCFFVVMMVFSIPFELGFLNRVMQENSYHLEFFGQPVTAEIVSGSVENFFGVNDPDNSFNLMVSHGYVRIKGETGFYIFNAKPILRILYVPIFLLLLRSIFHSLSIRKPFIMENVKRLRWLAILLLTNHIIKLIIEHFSDEYVKTKITFSTAPSFRMSQINYDLWLIFISILLLAEIIRYGAQLKEDQDLTV